MIPVTKPFLPPLHEYETFIAGIWQRNILTNNGPLVRELETTLQQYLAVKNLLYLSNGTIALQLAIKALGLSGSVITTPFSYVATTSSIVWEGCQPIFVDIDANTLNIDPTKIEAAIAPDTSAILATHCFGNPCDIESIDALARKHNLRVIYDAAHCFGTTYKGKSVFEYGDISTTSFHSTKLFHTIEGGAVFTNQDDLYKKLLHMRNFGHDGPEKFNGVGINGKNSEFHAAMGLCNLKYIEQILSVRAGQCRLYDELLANSELQRAKVQAGAEINYAYYPVIFKNEKTALRVKTALETMDVFPRRYFYPSLSRLDYISQVATPISDGIAASILCLPLYHDLSENDQLKIVHTILNQLPD